MEVDVSTVPSSWREGVTLGGLRAVNCEISLAGAYVTVWCGLRDRVHVEFGPPCI